MKNRTKRMILFSLVILGGLLGLMTLLQAQDGLFWVDKFSTEKSTEGLPVGWKLDLKSGEPEIAVEELKGNYFVHFKSDKASFGLRKDFNLDSRQYPILNWQWKVTRLPEKGNFLNKKTDDQAAQVYVLFPRFPAKLNTEVVGYLWESHPKNKGLEGESPAWSKSKVIILEAGTEKLNQWVFEKRNVYEDYKRLFGKEPPKIGGLSLYINTQHTQGAAESFFDQIYFSKN